MKTMGETMMTGRRRFTKPGPAMCVMASTSIAPGTANIGVKFAECVQSIEPNTVGTKTEKETDLKEEKEEVKDLRAETGIQEKEDNKPQDSA